MAEAGENRAVLETRVEMIELLGDEQLLHLTAGPAQLLIKSESHHRLEEGTIIKVGPAPGKIYVFDGVTGANVMMDARKVRTELDDPACGELRPASAPA